MNGTVITNRLHDWLIDGSVFNVQRAIFQLYSGRRPADET
jgi:hypothetical protein